MVNNKKNRLMRLPAISCVRSLKKNDNRGGKYKKQQQYVDSSVGVVAASVC